MQPLPTIDQLIFKGTHNSYQCRDGTNPIMNHPPNVQIDDFGVWAVELDVGVELHFETGDIVAVGHNGPGNGTCSSWGGKYLIEYLTAIRDTLAMRYRPVLIYFETKRGDDWIDLDPLDDCDDHAQKYGAAIEIVKQVFQDNFVELYKFRQEHNDMYPTVAEMAGKVIIYYPKPDFSPDHPNATCQGRPPFKPTLIGYDGDVCIRREDVENQIQRGVQVFRVDQYQADWTFDYGVPPNPLIVDWTAMPPWSVGDSVGDEWDCDNGDVWKGQIVHEQGTVRFPYKTVSHAITRAEGTTPNGVRDPKRAGYGWTVLIRPGNYPETLTIDIPLTLEKDDRFAGNVVIGR